MQINYTTLHYIKLLCTNKYQYKGRNLNETHVSVHCPLHLGIQSHSLESTELLKSLLTPWWSKLELSHNIVPSVPLTAFVIQHFLSNNNQIFDIANNTEPHIIFPHVAEERFEDTAMSAVVTT